MKAKTLRTMRRQARDRATYRQLKRRMRRAPLLQSQTPKARRERKHAKTKRLALGAKYMGGMTHLRIIR